MLLASLQLRQTGNGTHSSLVEFGRLHQQILHALILFDQFRCNLQLFRCCLAHQLLIFNHLLVIILLVIFNLPCIKTLRANCRRHLFFSKAPVVIIDYLVGCHMIALTILARLRKKSELIYGWFPACVGTQF